MKKTQQRKIECHRCGRCCWYVYNIKENKWRLCKYACQDVEGFTTCSRFAKRIGTLIGCGQICGYREMYRYDIPRCPYNSGKPLHPYAFNWINDG